MLTGRALRCETSKCTVRPHPTPSNRSLSRLIPSTRVYLGYYRIEDSRVLTAIRGRAVEVHTYRPDTSTDTDDSCAKSAAVKLEGSAGVCQNASVRYPVDRLGTPLVPP